MLYEIVPRCRIAPTFNIRPGTELGVLTRYSIAAPIDIAVTLNPKATHSRASGPSTSFASAYGTNTIPSTSNPAADQELIHRLHQRRQRMLLLRSASRHPTISMSIALEFTITRL